MSIINLTQENFREELERPGVLIIDWWAPWCGPCRRFSPVFEAAAERHPGARFAKINTEEQPELAAAFEIRAIPTLMVFRDRVLLYAKPGVLPAEGLDELATRAADLDMDEVKRQLAREEADDQKGGEQGGHEARPPATEP